MNIDVTKCIGCRIGDNMFVEEHGSFYHTSIFADYERLCHNSDIIKPFLSVKK